ncbi:hypothetical protein TNCV_4636561 [Trichonephila clavipes]|nr:hypothetical protein TNCV_4636561 [Trichonephila clavipes]
MEIMWPSKKKSVSNHVAKHLRTAVKEWRVKGVTLAGGKKSSLTDTTIIGLQNFYRNAMVDNVPEVDNMKTNAQQMP